MSPGRVAGEDLLSGPATLPKRIDGAELHAELVDLLCEDDVWLEQTFRDIVATSWAAPPGGATVRPAARPRRHGSPGRRTRCRHARRASQWTAAPDHTERSPPGRS
jgi:hypothetical protein